MANQTKHTTKALSTEAREAAFLKIWRNEHKDFRGRQQDGTRTILGWAKYGGGLVSAATITDAELNERLRRMNTQH